MNVRELRERLAQFDDEIPVYVWTYETPALPVAEAELVPADRFGPDRIEVHW